MTGILLLKYLTGILNNVNKTRQKFAYVGTDGSVFMGFKLTPDIYMYNASDALFFVPCRNCFA